MCVWHAVAVVHDSTCCLFCDILSTVRRVAVHVCTLAAYRTSAVLSAFTDTVHTTLNSSPPRQPDAAMTDNLRLVLC
jgi:hypothetical protein